MVLTIVLLEKHLSMDESQLFEQVQFPLACKIRMQTMAGKRVMWPLRLLPTHMPNTFAVRTMYVWAWHVNTWATNSTHTAEISWSVEHIFVSAGYVSLAGLWTKLNLLVWWSGMTAGHFVLLFYVKALSLTFFSFFSCNDYFNSHHWRQTLVMLMSNVSFWLSELRSDISF